MRIILILLLALPLRVYAIDTEPKAVISAQIEAFKANDLDTAFSFASPKIQWIFGTAKRFGQMVKSRYPMVWRPADVRFGAFTSKGGKQVQTVFFTDSAGNVFVASYEMLSTDTGWQIDGVLVMQAGVGA